MTDTYDAVTLVKKYLDAMIARDVGEAAKFIHADATIVYPGGKVFNAVSTLAESSTSKFKTLDKHFDRFDVMENADGIYTVYVSGRLDGTWADDGTAFTGIRFIDRYEVNATGITAQEVWSDSAVFQLAKLKAARAAR